MAEKEKRREEKSREERQAVAHDGLKTYASKAATILPGSNVPSEPAGVSARLEHSENLRAASSKVVSPASIFALIASAATDRASMSPPLSRICCAASRSAVLRHWHGSSHLG